MCGHLEILSVRSANLPAGEGVAFLSRNGSDCNIGIEDVGFSVTVILAVNLVGYVVLVDAELSIETNVLCRHGELAVSINSYDIRDIRPAGKGIAFLFRMSGSYGYVSVEGVGIDVAKLRCVTLLILIEVGHLGIDRNPLCVQVQAGHQNLSRIGGLASCVGIPAAELITVPSRETGLGIVERRIVGAGLGAVVIGCICTEVRMVGNVDCNVLDVAVNMDIQLVVLHALILDGVPYDLDVVYVEVVAQNRGIGQGIIVGAVFIPVARSKETEVGRNVQIFGRNAVYDIGNRIALIKNFFRAFLGERADIAGVQGQAVYAAVRLAARQVEFFALIIVVLRSAARRQKYEILSRGQFRFRVRIRVRSLLRGKACVQSQVFVRHLGAGPFLGQRLVGVPTVEDTVSLLSCRGDNRRIGINQTFGGVRASFARDFAAVQLVSQLVRIYVRGDVNLDGSVVTLCLGKVKTEPVLAVYLVDSAHSRRVEFYAVDGIILGLGLTNTNRRNREGLVVPELLGVENLTVIVTAINDDLIGYAAAIKMLCLFLVNRPVGNVDLNHLRIVGTNQIVEYQLVVPSECSPIGRILCTVL